MRTRRDIDWTGVIVAAMAALAFGLLICSPLAAFEFDFVFFEAFSIDKMAGTWSSAVQYLAVCLFSIFSGVAYQMLPGEWRLPFYARLPLALGLGILGMALLIAIVGFIIAALALIALLLALFFGPGDR